MGMLLRLCGLMSRYRSQIGHGYMAKRKEICHSKMGKDAGQLVLLGEGLRFSEALCPTTVVRAKLEMPSQLTIVSRFQTPTPSTSVPPYQRVTWMTLWISQTDSHPNEYQVNYRSSSAGPYQYHLD